MSDSKPTNPKDVAGSNKVPFHCWPESATILGSLALMDGMLRYGRSNWRQAGVKASIYHDACRRHMNAWFEGEEADPESGLPHLAHALACIAILVDAGAAGKLNDDRMVPGNYREFINKMTPHVNRLKELRKGNNPKHWTIADSVEVRELHDSPSGICDTCVYKDLTMKEMSDPCKTCGKYK